MENQNANSFLASDGIDPTRVPPRTLYTGAKIPAIGLGTFGSDRFSGEVIAEAVKGAISVGYRHIDCASVYENEPLIGQSLREMMEKGIKREELWITSKLWNDKHGEKDVVPSCEKSLKDLQLDLGQLSQHRLQFFAQFLKEYSLSILGNPHHVLFALPFDLG